MSEKSESIHSRMHADVLRQSWQGRALALASKSDNFQLRCALMSLLADNYDDTLPFLLQAVFGDWTIKAPFYCSNPKIDKRGLIVADLIMPDGHKYGNSVIFVSEQQMEGVFRRLADRLKLVDAERIDLFIAVRHWVKADARLDPTMDRRDPDARRLVLH